MTFLILYVYALSNHTSYCFWCQCCDVYNNTTAAYFELKSYHLFPCWVQLLANLAVEYWTDTNINLSCVKQYQFRILYSYCI